MTWSSIKPSKRQVFLIVDFKIYEKLNWIIIITKNIYISDKNL